MKKTMLFIIALFCCFATMSQDDMQRIIVFKLLDKTAKPIAGQGELKTQNVAFNAFLKQYNISKYEQLCPYSKNKDLLEYYYIATSNNGDVVAALKAMPKIVSDIEERSTPIPTYVPSDYMYTLTNQNPNTNKWLWHLKKIEAEKAWDITKGEYTIVAVVDTWFDVNHPDLKGKFKYDYDPKTGASFNDLKKIAQKSHGTNTSSCVGAKTDGGGQLASIGYNTQLIGYQYGDGVSKAHHASLVENADVVSISWCDKFGRIEQSEREQIKEILDNGTIIVASAGNYLDNNTSNTVLYPFNTLVDDRIICVSSTDYQDKHQYFDSNGKECTHAHYPQVTICAPGYDIMVATPSVDETGNAVSWPYYGGCRGTSVATPIVAGVCALMKSVNPNLTPKDAKKILEQPADPIADAAKYPNGVGAGRVNAYKAVMAAGTRSFTNTTFSGVRNLSAGYCFNLKNVTIAKNSKINLTARKEVNIEGPFEVPLGSELSININETARSN